MTSTTTTATACAAPHLIEVLSVVVLLWKLQNTYFLFYAIILRVLPEIIHQYVLSSFSVM
jgi:hypothetical protein